MARKNRFTTMLFLMLVIVLIAAGCSSKGNSPANSGKAAETNNGPGGSRTGGAVEITFWNLFGGGEGDFVDQIVDGFNGSQQEVKVKTLRLESGEYYAKFGTALASGKGPDVAVAHADRLAPFVKAGQLSALNELTEKAGFDFSEITDSNVESVSYDGIPYAVPIDTHFHMFYYNKDLLGEAGLLNEDGTPRFGEISPEGFKQFLTEIKSKVPGITPFSVNTPYFHEPFYNLYYQAGGSILTDDLSQADINNEKAIDVLKFYLDLYDQGLSDINDKTPWDTFHSGKSATWFGGVWEAGWHLGEEGLNVGITSIPPIFGSETHWAASHTLVIPEYVTEEKQVAAMKFMKYFTLEGGKIWAQAGHVPAAKAVTASDEYMNLPYREEFVASQKTVKHAPKTDRYNAIDTVVKDVLQAVIFKTMTPEDGVKGMEKDINEILQN
ncbi:ABC transporter substrate-binding protein [Paenibacillus woosongensis]|uniref:Sugar ABC transporter substrate-binding protein n=1 Tax=Paenibacillus woosongensis TaxID=307580 RepID=A0ABQ4MN00_9BACL|nr:ABC transporter substrate-binding protein [Paenibacillus woosongensis]GIP57390.1 sugar ABC transporter substrate-binding protein [Paenibacillus woosongensis]